MIPTGSTLNRERHPLFDTLSVAGGAAFAASYTLFSVPFSGTKARYLTNLPRPYQIAPGEFFLVKSIQIQLVTCLAVDWPLLQNYAVSLYVDNVLKTEGPLGYFTSGGGITGVSGVVATEILNNGHGNAVEQTPGIQIGGENMFSLKLDGASIAAVSASGVVIKAILDGVWDTAR